MLIQGALNSLKCLNPNVALAAIKKGRKQLRELGVYLACRPPFLRVDRYWHVVTSVNCQVTQIVAIGSIKRCRRG
jgi:hypothetical protein